MEYSKVRSTAHVEFGNEVIVIFYMGYVKYYTAAIVC